MTTGYHGAEFAVVTCRESWPCCHGNKKEDNTVLSRLAGEGKSQDLYLGFHPFPVLSLQLYIVLVSRQSVRGGELQEAGIHQCSSYELTTHTGMEVFIDTAAFESHAPGNNPLPMAP